MRLFVFLVALVLRLALLFAISPINPHAPRHLAKNFLWLPDKARAMGIHVQAAKGSGKSRLMGRLLAFLDFIRGTPTIVFEPNGPTIDNFIDKLLWLPKEYQEQLWKRV